MWATKTVLFLPQYKCPLLLLACLFKLKFSNQCGIDITHDFLILFLSLQGKFSLSHLMCWELPSAHRLSYWESSSLVGSFVLFYFFMDKCCNVICCIACFFLYWDHSVFYFVSMMNYIDWFFFNAKLSLYSRLKLPQLAHMLLLYLKLISLKLYLEFLTVFMRDIGL